MQNYTKELEGINIPSLSTYIYDMAEDRISESHPEFHKWIYEKYPKVENWIEKLYLFYNGIDEQPRYIGECGTEETPMFLGLYVGYKKNDCGVCRMGVNLNEMMLNGEPLNTQQKKYLRENKHGVIGYKDKKTYVCECNHEETCEHWDSCNHFFVIKWYNLKSRISTKGELCTVLNPISTKMTSELIRKGNIRRNKDWLLGYTAKGEYIHKCVHENICEHWGSCKHFFIISNRLKYSRIENNVELCTVLNPIRSSCKTGQMEKFVGENGDWLIGYTDKDEYILKCTNENTCILKNNCNKQFIISKGLFLSRRKHNIELCTIYNNPKDKPSEFEKVEYAKNQPDIIEYVKGDLYLYICPHTEDCLLWDSCDHTYLSTKKDQWRRINNGNERCSKLIELDKITHELQINAKREKFKEKNKEWLIDFTEDFKGYIHTCTNPETCEKWSSCKHHFTISIRLYRNRKRMNQEVCTILNNPNFNQISEPEKQVRKIIEDLGVEGKYNRRNIIFKDNGRPLELDIFIESLNIAIEFNGSYIHSMTNSRTERNQHILKAIKCAEKGIELITVWEDMPKDLIYYFLRDKFEGKDASIYKELLHPDLKYNEWSNDLGWYKGIPPKSEDIQDHFCYHFDPRRSSKGFPCYDSGKIIIPDELLKN